MSDYTDSLLKLADGARTPAKAHVGQSNNWLDAYGQNQSKSWGDYYDQYRKHFSGKQPEGYGAMMEGQQSMSPGNSMYQWMAKSQQNQMEDLMKQQQAQMDSRLNEYQQWMQNYWQQQNQMQQNFQQYSQPQQAPQPRQDLSALEEYMRQLAEMQKQPTLSPELQYLQSNPDVLKHWNTHGNMVGYTSPEDWARGHYQTWGQTEARDWPGGVAVAPSQSAGGGSSAPAPRPAPDPAFNAQAYLAANPDVAANSHYGANAQNALAHYLSYGQDEGRKW